VRPGPDNRVSQKTCGIRRQKTQRRSHFTGSIRTGRLTYAPNSDGPKLKRSALLDLSPQQKAAVQHVKGPLLVLGGAGTGKTSLLACKVAWLIRELAVEPAQIVVLANSVASMRMLRRGAEEELGRKLSGLSVYGFAELGLQFLQRRLSTLGLRPGFSLYDRSDSEAVIERLLREAQPQAADLAGAVARQIAQWKRSFASPPFTADAPGTSESGVAAWAYQRYEQRLQAANAVDVDDLVRKAVRLLTTDTLLLNRWRDQVRYLVVDEYERTSACEHELVRLLAADGVVLTAAGDGTHTIDDRALGSADHVARLSSDIPNLRVVSLDKNMRCSGRITFALNRIVAGAGGLSDASPPYGLQPGAPIRILRARNEQQEAEGIVAAVAAHQALTGMDYRNYAIVVRHPEQAPLIERALRVARIPYYLRGATTFFEQPEIRDLWAYLRVLSNPSDDDAFLRTLNTPRRDIDHATIDRLLRFAVGRGRPLIECALESDFTRSLAPEPAQALRANLDLLARLIERAVGTDDPAALAQDILAQLHYLDWLRDTSNDANIAAQRMKNVSRAIRMLQREARNEPGASLRAMFTRLQLLAIRGGAADNSAGEGVTLLTFAAAHGTEFSQVYVVGFEEGLLPAQEADPDIEAFSERYLAYFVVSRARDAVTFTVVEQRRLAGTIHTPRVSRFLSDLPPHDLQWINVDAGRAFTENTLANSTTYVDRGSHYTR
jgi:ATP-dependent DNA helicase Rep